MVVDLRFYKVADRDKVELAHKWEIKWNSFATTAASNAIVWASPHKTAAGSVDRQSKLRRGAGDFWARHEEDHATAFPPLSVLRRIPSTDSSRGTSPNAQRPQISTVSVSTMDSGDSAAQ